jgi:hypothetical protein
MASIINASTSSGIVQTADTSGVLQLQTANTTALNIDSSQNLTSTGWIKFPVYTVSTLPTAGQSGRRAFVSNALTPVVLSAVVGGGAITVPVFDNGTSWIVG